VSKLVALLQKDYRVVLRDGFIAFMLVYPAVIALACRWLLPYAPIEHIELYAAPAVITAAASILGMLLGYTLIEEREQQTWLLLRVLPLSQLALWGYLGAVTGTLTIAMSLVAVLCYGLQPAHPLQLVVMVVVSSAGALLYMLAMGAATENKVEGLAVGKLLSSAGALPLLVFVLPPAWQPLLWWLPTYWTYLGFISAYADPALIPELALYWPGHAFPVLTVVPAVLTLAGTVWLARVYRRRAQ
jgi:predicted permease